MSAWPALALDPNRAVTQYIHRIWQTQQGVPPGTIQGLWMTHDGYLWLGTQTGLLRFDGVEFRTAESIFPKMPENVWVRGAGYEDDRGAQWLPTNDQGVLRISPDSVATYGIKEGLPSNETQCVVPGQDAQLWLCTDRGLARIDTRDGDKIRAFSAAETHGAENVRAACFSVESGFWSGGDGNRISHWDGRGFEARTLTTVGADASVRALLCLGDTIWVGTSAGLIRLQAPHKTSTGVTTAVTSGVTPDVTPAAAPGSAPSSPLTAWSERLFTVKDGLVDNVVFALAQGHQDTLWIGTLSGFSRLHNGEFNNFRPEDGLSQSTVPSLYEDREGWLWVGTKHGLNQFVDGRAVPFTESEGLPSNNTGPLLEDHHGMMWIGSLDKGLARYDGHKIAVLNTRSGLASDSILALGEDAAGALWVGTERGLNRVEDGRVTGTYTTAQGLPSNRIRAIGRSRDGNLWIGTQSGLALYQQGRFVSVSGLPQGFPNGVVTVMGEDASGNLLVATVRGVYQRTAAGFHEILQNGAGIRGVDALFLDPDGLVWMGTDGTGLTLMDRSGKLTNISVSDGLFDSEIFGILRDGQDRFWMGSSKGLFSVSRSELVRFAAGEIKRVSSSPYSPTDGGRIIEGRSRVQPALWRRNNGIMWFSTTHGLILLEPNRQRSVAPLPVAIEDPQVNGQPVHPADISKMAPGQKNLEFDYSALSFYAANRITFKYKLEGFDKDWIKADIRRAAFYTNLPPGNYRFRVTACTIDGLCNETGSSIEFSLASHYYQRWWFWVLAVGAVGMVVWVGYQLRIRQLHEKYDLILAERSRIARELHDTLIQGFSGITMALQALAGRVKSKEERATLDDIIADSARCLRETRQSVAGLRAVRGTQSGLASAVEEATREIAGAKDVRLKFRLQTDLKVLPAEVEYNLLRIAREAVTNSVKHSGARSIEVSLDSDAETVNLAVKDDGLGFARDTNGGPGHYGLIGMKERAAQIGAEIELNSQPGAGTIVAVRLPITVRSPVAERAPAAALK